MCTYGWLTVEYSFYDYLFFNASCFLRGKGGAKLASKESSPGYRIMMMTQKKADMKCKFCVAQGTKESRESYMSAVAVLAA